MLYELHAHGNVIYHMCSTDIKDFVIEERDYEPETFSYVIVRVKFGKVDFVNLDRLLNAEERKREENVVAYGTRDEVLKFIKEAKDAHNVNLICKTKIQPELAGMLSTFLL